MIKRIVILGGGTGGTLAANRLGRELGDTAAITVVDRDNNHIYQPGLLFVPFGLTRPDRIVRPRARQLRPGIGYHQSAVDRVDIERRRGPPRRPAPSCPTTCWSSRPVRRCCPARPRA